MPFGNRRRQRHAEAEAIGAARSAVASVVACFGSDPDDYDVRSCIAIPNDSGGVNVLHFGWDDESIRDGYFIEGDAGAVIEQVTPAPEVSAVNAIAESWIGPACRAVAFDELPGLYQHVFVEALLQDSLGSGADLPLPLDPMIGFWICAREPELVVVRIFPSGTGESTPPIGEVGFVAFPRAAIEEMYRGRGW